jgi:O-antigen ligase
MLKRIVRWLGWGVVILALLRWVEVLVFANIGAWMGTRFTSQNNYGLLFSAYSPFLLIRAVDQRGTKRFLSLLGYLMLLGAVAINGSRGSWVAVSVGLALMLLLLALTQRKRLVGVLLLLSLLIAIGGVIFSSVPALYEPVMQRFDTMDSLETDKSYQIRGLMNQKSLSLFYDSPVFGVGVTRFRQVSVPLEIPRLLRYAPQEHFDAKTPHNSFLSFLAENGLMGALPLGSLLIFLGLRGGVTTLKGIMHHQYFLAAVFLAFVQMSMHMWAINNFGNTAPWFIYGLMGAVIIGNGSKHPK